MKNPKEKGSEYEREIGRCISLWLSNGERDDLASRTECSGGKFTATGKGSPGDLNSSHPICFPFFESVLVECKHWQSLEIFDFLLGKGDLYWYFKKTIEQAEKINKYPLMIVKQNYKPSLAISPPLPCFSVFERTHHLFGHTSHVGLLEDFLKLDSTKFLEECKVYITKKPILGRMTTDDANPVIA